MSAKLTIPILEWLDRICAWPVMVYRKYKYGYPYRRIYLGEGEWTILDQKDYYRFNDMNWSVCGLDNNIYAARLTRTAKHQRLAKQICYLHRAIMNEPQGKLVDHENRKGLDNRQQNLRFATHSENGCNKTKKANTSSRFVGVSFIKSRKKWAVTTKVNGKSIFLGYFDVEAEAAKAYDRAAIKYHGKFARLNFPEVGGQN